MGKNHKSPHIIQSLDKGLYLLEVVEQANRPLTLGELWSKLRWDKATIHRLLATLERRGYVLRDQETKKYSLGLKIYGLYNSLKRNLDIQRITKPYLIELAGTTGESAHLAVVVEKYVVFIDRYSSLEMLSVNTQIGAREPLYCTALGKAYLAFQEEKTLEELYPENLVAYTQRTITSIAKLRANLDLVRRTGYAVDDEEYIDGICCISAPILNEFRAPIAMIGISGPKHRLPNDALAKYGQLIHDTATMISQHCGCMESEGIRHENR
ncbi:MAG: IclR family transcriptional regulator [Spirochaetaceae bacterium]|nr:MAG: IclR family transcriptional regulator [Spirochaetaceae bacterium]